MIFDEKIIDTFPSPMLSSRRCALFGLRGLLALRLPAGLRRGKTRRVAAGPLRASARPS